MKKILKNQWDAVLGDEFEQPYYLALRERLMEEYKEYTIYPDMYDIFNALHYTDYSEVKAVILGQDPYHGHGQAHGLSFSVKKGVAIPPSLKNIFKELNEDLGIPIPSSGDLTPWAKSGVLLLNATLTVRAGSPNSHQNLGWQNFTNRVIKELNRREKPIVFILWGRNAMNKRALITEPRHFVISSAHPSPLSASSGFFGSKPFSKCNEFLLSIGETPIEWKFE